MLGVKIDPAYKDQVLRTVQQQTEHKRQRRLEQAQPNANDFGWDQDNNFAVIIGYTSGGAPYGLSWDEWDPSQDAESE